MQKSQQELIGMLEDAAKNWLAHDGLWFLAAEAKIDMETAIGLDRMAWERFTVIEAKRIMKRQDDEHFGRICQFFDTGARRCTVYEGRPQICRDFPAEKRCGYYDFLEFERRHQEDDNHVAVTDSSAWK